MLRGITIELITYIKFLMDISIVKKFQVTEAIWAKSSVSNSFDTLAIIFL